MLLTRRTEGQECVGGRQDPGILPLSCQVEGQPSSALLGTTLFLGWSRMDIRVGHQVEGCPRVGDLHTESLMPRTGLPPLLRNLGERAAEQLQWLGVSFGLTQQLYNFWRRSQFGPVYLRQSASDITGALLCTSFEAIPGTTLQESMFHDNQHLLAWQGSTL